jgi:polysaccharide export outer membrane protein
MAATVLACGAVHPAPAQPGDDPEFSAPEEVELAGLDEDPPQPLRLLPGDVVTLQTVSVETSDFEGLTIDEQGNIHVPLAGDVEVGGLTLTEAEGRVEEALQRYDRVVRVNLFITDPAGHRATVVGAVTQPGVIAVVPGMRLADLIASAGGPVVLAEEAGGQRTLAADLHGARLHRDGRVVEVSLPLALQGNPRHNIGISDG